MMNEISKYAKTLINDYAEEYQNYFEESNKNQSYFLGLRMELFGYIATLEAENEKLKAEAEKYEWKTGEPEAAGEYLVYVKNSEGDCRYLTSDYVINNYVGNWFDAELYDLDVLAYSEIRPFEKEGE